MWTESKRPRLNLAELHQLRWLLGTLLAALSAWTVPGMGIDAWFWLALITAAAPVMLWRPEWSGRLPAWAHRLAFPVILSLAAVDCRMDPGRVLPALVRLTLMLLLYRMVTARQRRDDLQVVVLGMFLVVVTGVLSVSVIFVLQILAFTACALLLLLTLTLGDAADAAREPPAGWTQVRWLALARRVHAVANWPVVLLGGGLFAGLVAVSSVVFIFLPRFELGSSLFLSRLVEGKDKTGFSETVSLGAVTDIQDDPGIAFTVDVSDREQVPATPYWRMLVLDEYRGAGEFRLSSGLDRVLGPSLEKIANLHGTVARPTGSPIRWTIYFEPGTSKYLPLPAAYAQVIFAEPPEKLRNSRELDLLSLGKPPAKMFAYRLEGLDFAARPAGPAEREGDVAGLSATDFTGLKPLDKNGELELLTGWAHEIAVRAADVAPADAEKFARGASGWLGLKHAYAMQVNNPPGEDAPRDPIVRWLASGQPGHCEYFASAFVLLARAAGFPARLVVGFKGGRWNPHSESLTVRNSEAHAWAEIYDAGKKLWLRVDPTPGASLFGDGAGALKGEALLKSISDSGFSARFESLRVFWYRRIVSFDQQSQAQIAMVVQQMIEGWGREAKAWLRGERELALRWLRRPWDWRRFAWGAAGIALVLVALRWWRVGRLAWLGRRGADPIRREAGRWLVRLTARDAVEATALREPLERLRYGAASTWPNPAEIFRAARRAVRD